MLLETFDAALKAHRAKDPETSNDGRNPNSSPDLSSNEEASLSDSSTCGDERETEGSRGMRVAATGGGTANGVVDNANGLLDNGNIVTLAQASPTVPQLQKITALSTSTTMTGAVGAARCLTCHSSTEAAFTVANMQEVTACRVLAAKLRDAPFSATATQQGMYLNVSRDTVSMHLALY